MFTHSINLEVDIAPEPIREIGEHDIADTSAVIHVINLNDFEDKTDAPTKKRANSSFNNKLLITLVLSLLLHALAFYLINLRVKLPSLQEDSDQPIIIQAKLYTPPKIEPTNKQEEVIKPETITTPEIQEPTVSKTTDESVLPEEKVIAEIPPTVQPEPLEEPIPQIEEPQKQDIETVAEQQDNTPIKRPQSLYGNTASEHLRTLNKNRQNNLATEAFREYQYKKTHPDINTNPQTSLQFTPEERRNIADQQLYQSRPKIKTDCKKVAGKVLNVLGYLAGGAVDCLKNPEISAFIKKRVEESGTSPSTK